MKLIIDIPEEIKATIDRNGTNEFVNETIWQAVKNGTPLEQEPCDNAINRQAVLEIFGYVMDYWKEHAIDVEPHEIEDALIEQYEFTAKQLSELPPVNPQEPKWIPVSERLPEDGQNVLFCDNDDDIMVGYHVKGRPSTHFSQDGTYDDMKNVRAWMPLPEPYKAESE